MNGKGTEAQNNVVCTNAAFAIKTYTGKSFEESFQMAKDSLLGGKAKQKLNKLVEISKL